MVIKYKILEVNESERSIVVRFYTDILTEEKLASFRNADGSAITEQDGSIKQCRTDYHINIWQVPTPTGEELHNLILSHAPVAWFELQEKILNPSIDTSMSSLEALINVEKTKII